jgi:hypothetical protein
VGHPVRFVVSLLAPLPTISKTGATRIILISFRHNVTQI